MELGSNSASMLGRTVVPQSNGAGQTFDPGQPIASEYFNPITDKVYTVEAGGHISVISLQCQGNLGFLSHNIEGVAVQARWMKEIFHWCILQRHRDR